jgi:hypothetical protein
MTTLGPDLRRDDETASTLVGVSASEPQRLAIWHA